MNPKHKKYKENNIRIYNNQLFKTSEKLKNQEGQVGGGRRKQIVYREMKMTDFLSEIILTRRALTTSLN